MVERTLRRELRTAYRAMRKASNVRANLPIGSTRARVTTANARWWTQCEEYDRWKARAHDAGLEYLIAEVEHAENERALAATAPDPRPEEPT